MLIPVVVRNAPGLFSSASDGSAFAVAAHEDGSTVTKENPARRGETITLYGTGFGPGDRPAVDGFGAPSAPAIMMADPVEVVAGETVIKPSWSGFAPGMIGMVASRFKVPEDATTGPLTLKVRVQTAESNSVGLPIE